MRFGGRTSVSQITRHQEFGGAPRTDFTRNNMPLMASCGVYRIDGTGRDTYIANDNGNNFAMHEPDKHPIRGTFSFGVKQPAKRF